MIDHIVDMTFDNTTPHFTSTEAILKFVKYWTHVTKYQHDRWTHNTRQKNALTKEQFKSKSLLQRIGNRKLGRDHPIFRGQDDNQMRDN